MDQVNNTLKTAWDATVEKLLSLPPEQRKHFALLLMDLADCYTQAPPSKKAIVLLDSGTELGFFSVGADEFSAYELLERAYHLMADVHTMDAPEKGLFN